jgi:hypothetical protein
MWQVEGSRNSVKIKVICTQLHSCADGCYEAFAVVEGSVDDVSLPCDQCNRGAEGLIVEADYSLHAKTKECLCEANTDSLLYSHMGASMTAPESDTGRMTGLSANVRQLQSICQAHFLARRTCLEGCHLTVRPTRGVGSLLYTTNATASTRPARSTSCCAPSLTGSVGPVSSTVADTS